MIDKTKYRLKGHESFIIREGWLTKGLMAVNEDEKVFSKFSGADALGVGTNMAKSIHYWMRTAGIVNDKGGGRGTFLTDQGKLILKYDPYIEDEFTLWLLHANIVRNYSQATSWNLFFNEITVSEFTREELFSLMRDKIIEATGEASPSERSIQDDCSAILSMYLEEQCGDDPEDKKISPFSVLGLINTDGKNYRKTRPNTNKISPFFFFYLIQKELCREDKLSISMISEGENMPGKLLNLNRIAVNDLLDQLANMEYLIVNRTAGIDMVYPTEKGKAADVLNIYYKKLEGIYEA